MDTFEAIEQRRSVKHYDPEHQMTDGDFNKIMEATILSPTSFNIQNWRFVRVSDKHKREQVKAAGWGQAQFTEASELIFVCGDLLAHSREPSRYWKNAPEEVANILVPMIGPFYDGNEGLQRDEAMRSGGMAGQTLMLAAKALGYDTCPMIGFDPAKVAEIVNLPKDHVLVMAIVIGKPLKPANARGGQLPLSDVVVTDTF